MRRRAKSGKENSARINERFARNLANRPAGKVIWFHAASVGESNVLLELAHRLIPNLQSGTTFLFTCQTQTAARLIETTKSPTLESVPLLQQMAPLDTFQISRRFINHWRPDIAIFAEGEVWPNLLRAARKQNILSVMVNARMTEKTLKGWARWPATAKQVFGAFEEILASDEKTRLGLNHLLNRDITFPGNLKSSLPEPAADEGALSEWKAKLSARRVLLAASTHAPEEEHLLAAWHTMPDRPFLIIAPRHPDRGDTIEAQLKLQGVGYSRLSKSCNISPQTEVLLADTMGQMGLWYRLADTVYLGGGHASGIGGHNPIEALKLGKPIVTGPDLFNFSDLARELSTKQGFTVISDIAEIAQHFPSPPPSEDTLSFLAEQSEQPMATTLATIKPLLKKAGL